jgi:hypothetical protein
MARSDWILPRADAACGKAFHADRRSAEGCRVALEFWNQATGRINMGSALVTYRCKRCGGFHVARRKIKSTSAVSSARSQIKGLGAVDHASGLVLQPLPLDDTAKLVREVHQRD